MEDSPRTLAGIAKGREEMRAGNGDLIIKQNVEISPGQSDKSDIWNRLSGFRVSQDLCKFGKGFSLKSTIYL
jgi:hypothetical protein